MKYKPSKLFIIVVGLVFSLKSVASVSTATAQIEFIRTHDPSQGGWAPPTFWLTLKGVSNAGNCGHFNPPTNTVLFVGETNQELSLALSAQASGSQIEVVYDDTILVNGFCKILYISIGNPAPTN